MENNAMRTLTKWNPVEDMLSLHEAMDRLVDSSAYGWSNQDSGERIMRLPIDAYSTDNEIVVTAALAGLKPENVEITVEGDNLTIKGEIPAELENVHYVLNERYHGPLSRTLQLNTTVDVEHIEASFEGGVLTLTLPKSEEVRPKQIKVKAVKAR
jgi:HSP20 family protein